MESKEISLGIEDCKEIIVRADSIAVHGNCLSLFKTGETDTAIAVFNFDKVQWCVRLDALVTEKGRKGEARHAE